LRSRYSHSRLPQVVEQLVGPSATLLIAGTDVAINTCNPAAIGQRWQTHLPDPDGLDGYPVEERTMDGGTEVATAYREPALAQTAIRATPAPGGQDLVARMTTQPVTRSRVKKADGTWRWTETRIAYDSYGLRTRSTTWATPPPLPTTSARTSRTPGTRPPI
jgi:hypothetical protein